jgi:dipeptidyl aminopeptidase/acylaminoacyl peptidase
VSATLPEPISAAQAAAQGKQWAELQSQGDWLCWLEFDPDQGQTRIRGRQQQRASRLLTPAGFSVRSRVHEYGGGSYRLIHEGLVFVNEADQGLYGQRFAQPEQLIVIHQAEGFRYADLQFDPQHNRIIAVEEEHTEPGVVHNRLVAISLNDPASLGVSNSSNKSGNRRTVLVEGADFYSSPRLSRDATQLAWISWNHPHQPWTSTQLWLAELDAQGWVIDSRALSSGQLGEQAEAIVQPEFGPDGTLFFISDRNGWWNLYRYLKGAGREAGEDLDASIIGGVTELLLPLEAEFCRAPWQLGQQAYVVLDAQRIGCSWWREGQAGLGVLQLSNRQLLRMGCWAAVHSLATHQGQVLAIAEPGSGPGRLIGCPLDSADIMKDRVAKAQVATPEVIEQLELPAGPVLAAAIQPQHLQIPSCSGMPIYGFLYRPALAAGQQQSLIIQLHGGPTAQADGRFDPLKQFWLQRGFALLDLNYRGSSGYGRRYRQLLQCQWGVRDVEDVIDAAQFFIRQGWVDPERVVVRGNSAGGYTTLQVLSQARGQQWLRAGASHYGISDLQRLASQTHKFESHYLDWLVGDLERQPLTYRSRSPIHRPRDFCRPLIFFQGGLDRVVPATQTYTLYNQLKGRGVAVDYLAFPDERHGFKQAANKAQVLEREWDFYARQLGLPGAAPEELGDANLCG